MKYKIYRLISATVLIIFLCQQAGLTQVDSLRPKAVKDRRGRVDYDALNKLTEAVRRLAKWPSGPRMITLANVPFQRFEAVNPLGRVLIVEPIDEKILAKMRENRISYDVLCEKGEPLTQKQLLDVVNSDEAMPYDILFVFTKYRFDASIFDALKKKRNGAEIKAVVHFSRGYNNTDREEAAKRGILVTNIPQDVLTNAMAELNIGLMLNIQFGLLDRTTFVTQRPDLDAPTLEKVLNRESVSRSAKAQIMFGELLRRSLDLDAMRAFKDRWDDCGIGFLQTVMHDQLATDEKIGVDTQLFIIGGGDALRDFVAICRAHGVKTPILYHNPDSKSHDVRLPPEEEKELNLQYDELATDIDAVNREVSSRYIVRLPGSDSYALEEIDPGVAGNVIDPKRILINGDFDEFAKLAGDSLEGKTLSIAGLGAIGCAIAGRASDSFGMKIIGHDVRYSETASELVPPANQVSKEALFEQGDFVAICTSYDPNDPNMKGWAGKKELMLLRPGSTLLNTARGQLIDEAALTRIARERPDLRFGLDVLQDESKAGRNWGLINLPNVICTCHTGSAVWQVRGEGMAGFALGEVIRILTGARPLCLIKEMQEGQELALLLAQASI